MTHSRSTLASEGVMRGFYAGTSPALVAYVSENSVLFTALGQTQKLVARVRGKVSVIIIYLHFYFVSSGKKKIEDLSLIEKGAAGSCASLFSGKLSCHCALSPNSHNSDLRDIREYTDRF